MSKYSEKRGGADCAAVPGCPSAATTLRLINGRPEWICPDHLALVDERTKRGMP